MGTIVSSPWLPCLVEIMRFASAYEAGSGGFGSEIALWGAEKFVADHELTNGGGAQQRRQIMGVQVPDFAGFAPYWGLMEAHGIRKRHFEQIVVTNGYAAKNVTQQIALFAG